MQSIFSLTYANLFFKLNLLSMSKIGKNVFFFNKNPGLPLFDVAHDYV